MNHSDPRGSSYATAGSRSLLSGPGVTGTAASPSPASLLSLPA